MTSTNDTKFNEASGYTLTVEKHAVDVAPALAGMTTYRLYVDLVNTDDFLSSVYGNDTAPLSITTESGFFYNDAVGSAVASDINPELFSLFPSLEGDSWITIGIDANDPRQGDEGAISTVEDPAQPFVPAFQAGSDGTNIKLNTQTGGAWYVLNGKPNGFPDANGRVLIMQLTTGGSLSGTLSVQIFENGDSTNALHKTFTFDGTGTFDEGSGAVNDAITSDPIDNKPIMQLNDNMFLVGFTSTLSSTLNETQVELAQKNAEHAQEIAHLQAQLTETQTQLTAAQSDINALDQQKRDLERQISDLEALNNDGQNTLVEVITMNSHQPFHVDGDGIIYQNYIININHILEGTSLDRRRIPTIIHSTIEHIPFSEEENRTEELDNNVRNIRERNNNFINEQYDDLQLDVNGDVDINNNYKIAGSSDNYLSSLDDILVTSEYIGDNLARVEKERLLTPLELKEDEIPYRTYVRVFKSSESYEPVPHADEEPYGQ